MEQSRASGSAENVAAARAYLTRRGTLDDVYADRFVGRPKRLALEWFGWLPRQARANSWIAARTRSFDELVTGSVADGVRQVVIVAAGYDSRAWRLARDGVRFIEVDHPATQARKRALAPSGGPVYVAADLVLEDLSDVLEPHVTQGEPMVLICEGLTYFLSEADVRRLLSQAARISPGRSRLGVNFASPESRPHRWRPSAVPTWLLQRLTHEPLRFALRTEDAPAFLAQCGWPAAEVITHADLHARFLRGTNLPLPSLVSSYMCEATK